MQCRFNIERETKIDISFDYSFSIIKYILNFRPVVSLTEFHLIRELNMVHNMLH